MAGTPDSTPGRPSRTASSPVSRRWLLRAAAGATLALGAAVTSPGHGVVADVLTGPAACGVPPREPVPFAAPDPSVRWSAPAGPTPTDVIFVDRRYVYLVNGQRETVRGMGYNPPIGPGLTETDRRQRLEQDLTLMAVAGVNTLVGWNPAAFDGLTLDVAWQAGLGVTLPFDVDFTTDMRDPWVRRAFTDAVLAWVDQYRAHPAVRMWAIGNEVLQRSVPPAWCNSGPTAEEDAWAAAWSSLVVETADLIRARDPYHPVLYREAEDSYAAWMARALADQPANRPWFVYGVNAYTPRLAEIIEAWPEQNVPACLLISEYAPLNAPHGERSEQFRSQWAAIRARPEYVLGGAVYVWSTDGPEDVDRQFGLVDATGVPVDDALKTISALYHADAVASGRTGR